MSVRSWPLRRFPKASAMPAAVIRAKAVELCRKRERQESQGTWRVCARLNSEEASAAGERRSGSLFQRAGELFKFERGLSQILREEAERTARLGLGGHGVELLC